LEAAFFVETSEGKLPVRRASIADLDAVHTIIQESARWLLSRGIRQWESYLSSAAADQIRRRIETADTYLVFNHPGDPIATCVIQWNDAEIWSEQGNDGLAGYVHGLAVRRSSAGNNLGHALLTLAAQIVAQKPRPFLRLDCMATNERLCRYYRDAGFEPVRVNELRKNQLYIQLFQKRT
jgi:ribosomal protein S18 acetylase RimI-like enzyme